MMMTKRWPKYLRVCSRQRTCQSEAGSTLVLVLIFVTVLGLAMSVLLGAAGANLLTSDTVTRQDHKVYGADAGVAYGIQRLQLDPTACSDPGNHQTLTPAGGLRVPQAGDNNWYRNVTVQCSNLSGSSVGIGGFALVVTGTRGSIQTSNGNEDRPVQGPLYTAGDWSGLKTNKAVDVQNGSIFAGTSPCLHTGDPLPNQFLQMNSYLVNGVPEVPPGPYSYCPVTSSIPDAPHALPDAVPPEALPPTLPTSSNPWTVYYPGRYDSNNVPGETLTTPAMAYFASGVYYFDNVNIVIGGVAVAGKQGSSDDKSYLSLTSSPPPPTPPDPAGTVGTGAEFILGGSSTIANTSNSLEIFDRAGGPSSDGSPNVSLLQVVAPPTPQTLPPGWDPSQLPLGTPIANVKGNNVNFIVHGIVYAPQAQVNLNAVNTSIVRLAGGVKVQGIALDAPSSIDTGNFVISIDHNAGSRKVVITSTVPAATNDKQIVSTAVVDFHNNGTPPTIDSWSTDNED
jgi:hypothetical protein